MKLKTTKKQIKDNSRQILSVGYCALQSLLRYESPFAFSAGVYGWACDYYNINGVVISTGYQPIGTPPNYSMMAEYETKAQQINSDYSIKYDDQKAQTTTLLNEFVTKATQK